MLKFFYQNKKTITAAFLLLFIFSGLIIPLFKAKEAQAQGIGYTPRYPERLKKIVSEMSQSSNDLVYFNQQLENLTEKCNCSNAQSECGRNVSDSLGTSLFGVGAVFPKVFGDPCADKNTPPDEKTAQREKIERAQLNIKKKNDEISYLRKLLEKEKESGLEAELKTLRTDEANELKANLENLIGLSKNITPPAENNVEILNNNNYSVANQCRADCQKQTIIKLVACLFGGQEPVKIIFGIGAYLEKLNIGMIQIVLGLNLPDRLELANLSNLDNIKVYLPDVRIPLEGKNITEPIIINPPSPELPPSPDLTLSCPVLNNRPYYCESEEKGEANYYSDLNWYSKVFSWLSEQCQEIPGMKNKYGIPNIGCLNPDNVQQTIINKCSSILKEYSDCVKAKKTDCKPPSGICASLEDVYSPQKECIKLFGAEEKDCYLNIIYLDPSHPEFGYYATPESKKRVLALLKNKCSQLKEEKKAPPESCKFLPLLTGETVKVNPLEYQNSSSTCPSQTLTDDTAIRGGLNCPLLVPNIPGIRIPPIKIPDIRLPSISFMPFFRIKLPSFIFEDLVLPELRPCSLGECRNIIPPIELSVPYPSLLIPPIDVPPISLPYPGLRIKVANINFPPLPISMPRIDLSNFIRSNIDLPKIPKPKVKIVLREEGINVNAFSLLLGMVAHFFSIPSGCVVAGISLPIPLDISFPDYYFYWPKFPEVPDLCNNINEICYHAKSFLSGKVFSKINEFQNVINNDIQNNLQVDLDEVSKTYNTLISNSIRKYIEKNARVENGILIMRGGEVPLLKEEIDKQLSKIPTEIYITWPEKLREIHPDEPLFFWFPPIDLSDLGYMEKIEINAPGFQIPSFKVDLSTSGEYPGFEGQPPLGGNPYPIREINSNLIKIKNISNNINAISKKIDQILE